MRGITGGLEASVVAAFGLNAQANIVRIAGLAILAVLLVAAQSTGAPITYDVTGHVSIVDTDNAAAGGIGDIKVGDPFWGSFTYADDMEPHTSHPTLATYKKRAPTHPLGISVTVQMESGGTQSFASDPSTYLWLHVYNDGEYAYGESGDAFQLASSLVQGYDAPYQQMEVRLYGDDAIWSSTDIPTALSLPDFTTHDVFVSLEDDWSSPGWHAYLTFDIESMILPEPSTLALLCTAALGIFGWRRRK
jgi:hypothetical protein